VIRILMLGAPPEPHAHEVLAAMEAEEHVDEVHHLHLWQMDEAETALEAHVVVSSEGQRDPVRLSLRAMLSERFGIDHATVEMETPASRCEDTSAIGH
jgi:cobalt-zinc-cadmium efflux system protein